VAKKKTKARPKKKYNPLGTLTSTVGTNLEKAWFLNGNCIDGVQAGGIIRSQQAVQFILSQPRQWSIVLMIFGHDQETGAETTRTEEVAIHDFLMQDELRDKVNPMLVDFCHRIGNYGGVDVVSTGYFMSPSINADVDGAIETVIQRFRKAGAFNPEICRMMDELRPNREVIGKIKPEAA